MANKNKFIYCKTKAAFNSYLEEHRDELYNCTTFIQDSKEIYTHGNFYKASNRWAISSLTGNSDYATLAYNSGKVGDIFDMSSGTTVHGILGTINDKKWYIFYKDSIREYIYSTDTKKFTAGSTIDLANDSEIPDPATVAPKMDGTAAVGSSNKYAREDHVHPSDNTKQDILVSGESIRTINNLSLLGNGNINVGDVPSITVEHEQIPNETDFNRVAEAAANDRAVLIRIKTAENTLPSNYWHYSSSESQRVFVAYATYLSGANNLTLEAYIIENQPVMVYTYVDELQEELVSGTNIKTINGESILGSGNIDTPDSKVTSAANHYTPVGGSATSGTIINSITKDEKGHIVDIGVANGIDAGKITSGVINIERLPKGALERLVIVENQTARYALTTSDVQEGDTVKQEDTGVMYFVVDTSNLANENGYKVYTAGSATSVPWSGVTGKPSTFTPSAHNQASNTITSLTGYTKGTSAAISVTDSLNTALGKLEGKVDLKANTTDLSKYLPLTGGAINGPLTVKGITTSDNILSKTGSGAKLGIDSQPWSAAYITTVHGSLDGNAKTATTAVGLSSIPSLYAAGNDIKVTAGGQTSAAFRVPYANSAGQTTGTLTFTGAATGTFNGSGNVTINIPSGGGTGTVKSVAMTVPTGLVVSGSPITSSGTFAITYDDNYSIPTKTQQNNWNTAYGWGNHATAGYTKNTGTVTSVTLTQGTGITVSSSGTAITTSGTRTISLNKATSTTLGGIMIGYTESGKNYPVELDSSGKAFVNVPWTDNNYYPTTFKWTNGTSTGPTGSLTGSGMSAVSFPAIPAASNSISGVVTISDQVFSGRKTFSNGIIVNNSSGGELYIDDADNIGASVAGPGFHIFAENDLHIISMENNRVYFGMDDECYIEADTFSGTANMAKKVTNPLTIIKGSKVTTYDGSVAESITIPAIANLNLSEHTYTNESTLSILKGGCYYHTGSSTASTITLAINTISWSGSVIQNETPDSAIVVIEGTTTVKFTSNTKLKLQNNIPLTGTSGTYRVYAFQKINSNLIMVNCAVYKNS